MSAELSDIKCIHMQSLGLQHYARIKNDDVLTVSGVTYVRLAANNWSLKELICENNPLAPDPMPKGFSLSCSQGMLELVKLRNEAQARSLEAEAGRCCLWERNEDTPTPKKLKNVFPRACRDDIERKRAETTSIGVEVSLDQETRMVEMLRPVLPRDNLFVLYHEDTLGFVIRYMRAKGFSEKLQRFSEEGLRGVRRRTDGRWIIKYEKQDGGCGYKSCKDKDEATAFLSNPYADCIVARSPSSCSTENSHNLALPGHSDVSADDRAVVSDGDAEQVVEAHDPSEREHPTALREQQIAETSEDRHERSPTHEPVRVKMVSQRNFIQTGISSFFRVA